MDMLTFIVECANHPTGVICARDPSLSSKPKYAHVKCGHANIWIKRRLIDGHEVEVLSEAPRIRGARCFICDAMVSQAPHTFGTAAMSHYTP